MNIFFKRFLLYFGLALLTVILVACASNKSKADILGPFYKAELAQNGLIKDSANGACYMRIVYPYTARNPQNKKIIDNYINSLNEVRIFNDAINIEECRKDAVRQTVLYRLGIYGFTLAEKANIFSLAFQVQYSINNSKLVSYWYTLNYDSKSKKGVTYDTLFQNTNTILPLLAEYIKQDINRQRSEQNYQNPNILIDLSNPSLKERLSTFALLPANNRKNKMIGIRVYISQYGMSDKDNQTSFAVNIPYSIIKPYLKKDAKKIFISQFLPLVERPVNEARKVFFPDLEENF